MKKIIIQSGFVLACFSFFLFSCTNSNAAKEENNVKADSLIAGLSPKALSQKLHDYTLMEVRYDNLNLDFVTVIHEVFPAAGQNYLVSFADSSVKGSGILLDGIVILDAKGKITDCIYPDKSIHSKGSISDSSSLKFQDPELKYSGVVYHANQEGVFYIYDSITSKFHQKYPDSTFILRIQDVPLKYIDTVPFDKQWTVKDGRFTEHK